MIIPASSHILTAALRYARRGIPVFPCEPGGKRPLTRRGFKDATTDESKIRAWWRKWPEANVAIPTGAASGVFVLDVDPGRGGEESLRALKARHGPLPETCTVATGGGGLHFYFRMPAGKKVRCSAGSLGEGLDIRGDGGYVLVPPSRTGTAYQRRSEKSEIAEAPAWLVEALEEKKAGKRAAGEARFPVAIDMAGPKIPEGRRNVELTRIAGRLHDGTRDLARLTADLAEVNERRCSPPLPDAEVEKIAASIHRRKPAAAPSPQVLKALSGIEEAVFAEKWPGARWKTPRSVMMALLQEARRHGTLVPAGVRVSISYRQLALAAATSKQSLSKAIRRLKEAGWLTQDNADRRPDEAGAFVLRAKLDHPSTKREGDAEEEADGWVVNPCAPRLRWTKPKYESTPAGPVRTTVKRLGKTAEYVLDVLERAGGSMDLAGLAEALGMTRRWELLRRPTGAGRKLKEAGVVEVVGEDVRLREDWLEALECERELTEEIADYERDRKRYKREREGYRARLRQESRAEDDRRGRIEAAIARLFADRPDYRARRLGQITCALVMFDYLPRSFRVPTDAEVEEILDGEERLQVRSG